MHVVWDRLCQHCKSLLLKYERKGFCCNNGKALLPLWRLPNEGIIGLWRSNDEISKLFDKKIREINRSYGFSYLQTDQFDPVGTYPGITVSGRAHQILPSAGSSGNPELISIFFMDPQDQLNARTRNINGANGPLLRAIYHDIQQFISGCALQP